MIPINVEIGLNINNKIEYIPLGIFNIEKVKKDDFTIKITAYDNMSKFKVPYFSSLGDTVTLTQVANEIAAKTGVQFEGSLPNYSVKKLEGFSCREVLSFIASLCGGNAIIKRNGKFTIIYPNDINQDIGEGVFEFTREETKYKIGKITCKVEDKTLSKGSLGADSMEMQFENPWMNESILTDIYNRLNGYEYLGYNIKWQGNPSLDIGDIITHKDDKGVIRKLPIFNMKLSYDGGLDSELSAKGETKNKNSSISSGSMKKKIDRVVTELAIVNEALIDVAYIGDLTAGNIKFDTASGTIMDLQTLLAKFVTGENGQFLNLTTDNVTISNALIKDVIAKSISVEDLKASTISTNKFRITSDNGGIEIVGATQQFKDKNNKVRIQIGQDTQGNFNFILRGEDGTTTLIDHTGIKEKAIADDLIKEKMIAENAVGEKQINYSSLVTGLNKDANTSLIQASKVAIDLTGQSLEVSFNSLKSNVDSKETRNFIKGSSKEFREYSMNSWNRLFYEYTLEELGLKVGDTITFSCYFKFGDTVDGGSARITFNDTDLNNIKTVSGNVISSNAEGLSYVTTVIPGNTYRMQLMAQRQNAIAGASSFKFEMKNEKLEKGDNPNPVYSQAPEDVEEKIESNTTAITVAQGKIEGLIKESSITKGDVTTLKDNYTSIKATVDGINTTVASHTSSIGNLTTDLSGVSGKVATVENKQASLEQNLNGFKTTVSNTYSTKTELNTAKIDAINSANNSTDNKLKNYSTTIAMNTAITQSANSVKTEVSNTYLSKGDATNTYATKASMELTSTQLRLEFKSSGGGNLLKNGRPIRGKRGLANWYCSNSAGSTAVINLGDGGENLNGEVFGSGIWWNGTRESAGGNTWCCLFNNSLESYKFNKGKTYYVSLIIYSSTSGKNININIVDNNGLNHVGGYNITLNAGYQLVQFNFSPAQAGNKPNLGLYLNTPGSYNFYIPWAVVGEGYPVNNWIPNDNEIEDGNTTIDATGVKIYNGALTVLNNNGQVMLHGDTNGNLSFSGRLQPYDYQIRLFGNDCRIDGSAGAIRMQWNPQNYISVENGATRMYDNNSAGGTRYISFATDTEGHANIWGIQTRMKLLGNSSARPVIQSRNISDNAYGDFHGADFLNRSTIKDKTNVQEINDIDFKKLLMENTIKKYNLKTDVETVLDGFGLENTIDEVVASSADIRLGFILEELTQDARAMLSPGNMESISIYSMCSILWKVCQEQQKRIEVLENLQ